MFLDSAGELVAGSNTLPLETSTGGLTGLIIGVFGPGGQSDTGLTGSGNISSSGDGTSASVNAFEGNAKILQADFMWNLALVVMCVSLAFLH